MESTVIRGSSNSLCRRFFLLFGGGILVMASRAATAGGTASGEWTSLPRRADKDRVRLDVFWKWCFCLIGICTALDGVIGRAAEFAIVDDGGLLFWGEKLPDRDDMPLDNALLVV
jgi:hypothetical protein